MSDIILEKLKKQLSILPGLGPRSAKRMMLHLLLQKEQKMRPLMEALQQAYEHSIFCSTCGNLCSHNPCNICQDTQREQSMICVVESINDLWAMERAHVYRGFYHVLGGVISAIDGVTPDKLNIDTLIKRASSDTVREVILATNVTLEGQATAHYIKQYLEDCNVTITRLAHGLPAGGELDYMDDGTLKAALIARDSIE